MDYWPSESIFCIRITGVKSILRVAAQRPRTPPVGGTARSWPPVECLIEFFPIE